MSDGRDGASLKAGLAGEFCAGHRLVLADEIENDAPVDVAGSLAARNSEVVEVDLAHVVWEHNYEQSGAGVSMPGSTVGVI